ncbi:metal transporter CNNM [Marchantia polymorpha subsp. ruderalis]|uniref:CNNM transmembrane domain-containing protein n=3 Tax=Marchantia polymorpha TaxID=3197 RepID=A0AAF6BU33_MARPO|nr:hypothetical protein MARPO_0045s0045 [Marchantia polymorpha]BBN15517.1 hypothetical protein Mp_6g20190 [Marchantia polymorpha subsp. ruderalis]|eukprot:PTQ39372.1 hypothetical protein MARPO_0045s0045 [Marchantia polymorpha]
MASHQHCCGVSFWLYIMIIVGLVLFAGLMSGLTLGLMSLGLVDLEVLMRSGTPADRKHAAKILPVVRNQHLLLCTLLIGNALAMEALPIFLDSLVEAWGAILISVTLILMFGEIFPQAICTRYGLAVGAFMSPVVRLLVMVFFPVSYPISKLLDKMLGKGHVALFRRAELKTLVDMHGNEAGKGGELTHDETTIIAGALELTEKTAVHAMTPISSVFSIDINAKLDLTLMNMIMSNGHSRIPVYSGSHTNIIGLILVKNLLAIRAQDEVPVRNLTIRKIPRVPETMPLYDILNEFQKGHSHMAVVVKYSKEKQDSMQRNRDGSRMERSLSSRRHSRRTSDSKGVNYKVLALDIPESDLPLSETGSPRKRLSVTGSAVSEQGAVLPTTMHKIGLPKPGPYHPGLKNGDESLPPEPLISQKSRRRDPADVILDMSPESLLNFPHDEEVVGIITMEDLIEELLQEEILDETDEYIDVHNKIKVNLLPPGGRSPASPAPSFPITNNSSFVQTPAPTSPLSSAHAYTPVQTPVWNSAPGSPLAALARTSISQQPLQQKSNLQDNGESVKKSGGDDHND